MSATTARKEISFDVSKQDSAVIKEIAKRAVAVAAKAGWKYNALDANMDITACHANGNPLQLVRLRDADDFNFAHDVFGIRRHINHETGELENCFSPRFSR